MSNAERAAQLFRDGHACSQAILAVYGEPLGVSRDTALRIAAGFAGGMRMAETCGAVTGAFMVLGLRYASDKSNSLAGRAEVYARLTEYARRFRERTGSLVCRDLLGCDISTPEGMAQAKDQGLFKTRCVELVETAGTLLDEMLREHPPGSPPGESSPSR